MNDLFTVAVEYKEINKEIAQKGLEDWIKSQERTTQSQNKTVQSSTKLDSTTKKLTQSVRQAATSQDFVRQKFLATANSIAVLDGPLGGVASRFSAFGVLTGRIGVSLALAGVAFSALSMTFISGIRSVIEYEASLARLDALLGSSASQINMTSQEVSGLAESIAMVTLENENNIRSAAAQLATFRKLTTDVFEDVLRSAADLAALGFGTIESETVKLAKALEDPRQGLTSLSRAGITFTRQQRELIISLVDTGERAQAMALIMENVNKQVGGVGEAAARDTMAGQMDTIGQALRTATRESAAFIAEFLQLDDVIEAVAGASGRFLERRVPETIEDQISAVRDGISIINSELENAFILRDKLIEGYTAVSSGDLGADGFEFLGQVFRDTQTLMSALRDSELEIQDINRENLSLQEAKLANLQQEVVDRENISRLQQLDNQVSAVDDLLMQINMRQTLIGLTEDQMRNTKMLAEAELLNIDVNRVIRERTDLLISQGVPAAKAVADAEALRSAYEKVTVETLNALSARERNTREAQRIVDSVADENSLMEVQIRLLEEARAAGDNNFTVTEARRLAQIEIEKSLIEQVILENEVAIGIAEGNNQLAEAARLRSLNLDLAAGIAELEGREVNLRKIAGLGRPDRKGGGGKGGGKDPNAEYKKELDSLNTYLERRREEMMIANGFERELLVEQYDERFQTLNDALERKLLSEQDYADKVVELTRSREDKIASIERAAAAAKLDAWSGALGDLGSLMSSENEKIFKIGQAAAIAQAVVNGYSAAVAAWDKGMIAGGPPVAAAFTAMSLARTGSLIAGIGGQQPSGRGGSSGRTANAPREARELAPQRVLIQGLDPQAFYTGEQLTQLFEAFYSENDNRGRVFVVN